MSDPSSDPKSDIIEAMRAASWGPQSWDESSGSFKANERRGVSTAYDVATPRIEAMCAARYADADHSQK